MIEEELFQWLIKERIQINLNFLLLIQNKII